MSAWAQRRPTVLVLAGAAALSIALAGCSASSSPSPGVSSVGGKTTAAGQPSTPVKSTMSPEAVLPASLTSSVKSAASGVAVDTPVSVTAKNGTLTSVVFRDGDGKRLLGAFNHARTRWTASEFLDPDVHYTLRSTATNAAGKTTHSMRAFTTERLTLDQQTYPNVTPLAGSVMGIGMPVIVTFDVPVTDRAEMQKYMTVTSTPAQPGSWHWVSSQEVHWRPRTYWQPGTKVDVKLDLNGVNAGNGIYGQLDRDVHFSIGRSVLVKANVSTDQMQVYVDGKMARRIPITGGKPGGFQTRSGIKLISEKFPVKRMNSATVGIDPNGPEGYDIPDVQFAMRVTNSGEFLHAAPWSVYAQGHYNVSHGCVGMSTANAQWLYGLAEIGTPVQVTGSTRPLEPGNGWTDWNESWPQYTAASAR
jgi:lipoprotein-anchoring transpeptidase ErfK/SrfK